MRRIFVLSIIFILVFSGMVHAKTYKIANVAWVGWSHANVAEAKGFWKDEGLDVKVFTTQSPQEVLSLFKDRFVDLAFAMIGNQVAAYMEGLPIIILAETDWSHGGDKIIVKKDLDATVLKKKPIGIYYNDPSVTFFLHQYLSSIGLKLSDTRIIEMEPDELANHFISGQFGIIVCYDPEAIRAEREGNGKVVATTATYEGCMPEGLMVLEDVLNTIPPEDLVKIFKGLVKAGEWSRDPANWKEYMEILNNFVFKGHDPYSEQDLQDMVAAVRIHDINMLRERNQDDGGLHTYLQDLKAFLAFNNMLKKDFTPEKIFSNTAIIEALNNP